jgi:hypothetical protein
MVVEPVAAAEGKGEAVADVVDVRGLLKGKLMPGTIYVLTLGREAFRPIA